MDDNLSQSNLSQGKARKTFLIKKKAGDELKGMKNMSQLPGLPNYLIQGGQSNVQIKPTSSQDQKRMRDSSRLPMDNQTFNQSKGPQTLKSSELLNENDASQEEDLQLNSNQVQGPQLKMDKEYISFLTITEHVGFDHVIVVNNGSASIYYEWKRINGTRLSTNAIQDVNEERFFCHHEQNVIKPGERIRFVFSFLSKLTGIFTEEWQLRCEPPATEPLPNLKLTGTAYRQDQLIDWRKMYENELDQEFTLKAATEVVEDIMLNIRTPTPPLPDLNDPEQCKIEFEELNLQEKLWYSPEVLFLLRSTNEELCDILNQEDRSWNLDVSHLRNLMQQVEEEEDKILIERKFNIWMKYARKLPITKSPIYHGVAEMLGNLADEIPKISEGIRKELEMWDYTFKIPPDEDLTPEEQKAKADELAKLKADWLKKAKKKKWNEELEKELVDEYRKRFSEKVSGAILDMGQTLENEAEIISVGSLVNYDIKWDVYRRQRKNGQYWQSWMHKKTIVDAEVEGKKVTIRVHLRLAKKDNVLELKREFEEGLIKEKEDEEKRLEEERLEKERLAKEAAKKKGKGKPQQKQKQQEEQVVAEVKKRDLSHIDQDCLREILEMVRNLLDRQAKIVVVAVSYDQPRGSFNFPTSTKFFYEWLKQELEQPCYFHESAVIDNMDEQMENQVWVENSVLVLENLFFECYECGIMVDQEGQLQLAPEPDVEELTPYRSNMPYAPIYVMADKSNFFSNTLASINQLKCDQMILGTNILLDVQTVVHNLLGMNARYGTVLIGGKITKHKMLAIDELMGLCDSIVLLGQIGFSFYCTMYDIEHERVSATTRKVIKEWLRSLQEEIKERPPVKLTRVSHVEAETKPKARLICPQDFLVATIPEEYDPMNEEHVESILQSVTRYIVEEDEEGRKSFKLEENQILVDYGPDTLAKVAGEMQQAQRVIWMDDANLGLWEVEKTITVPDPEAIALLERLKEEEARREEEQKAKEKKGRKGVKKVEEPKVDLNIKTTKEMQQRVFNESNRELGRLIYQMQEEKKARHGEAQKNGQMQVYNYEQDCVFTLVGERLEEKLNEEDFQEHEQKDEQAEGDAEMEQKGEEDEEGEEMQADKQSSVSQLKKEKEKVNQVKTFLADYHVRDIDFVLKVLSGEHCDCLKTADQYQRLTNSEIDEEQFFEDEDHD